MESCVIKEEFAILKQRKLIFSQKSPGCMLGGSGSEYRKVHCSGLKHKFMMQCKFTVHCREEHWCGQGHFPTSAAKQAFKSTDRHTFLHYMQGNVTQSIAYVNVKLAAIISLNSHEIFSSVIHMRKQHPLKLNKNDNYFTKECIFN